MSFRDVLLDLLNTTPVVDGTPTDALDGEWLRAHGASRGVRLTDAVRLRDDLQLVARGEAGAEVLGGYLDGVSSVPRLHDDGIDWTLHADWPAKVVLAWGEIQAELPGRLRPCANDECRLFLLDRTRGGTAKWCSMSGCGNRLKARRHYGRSVQPTGD